MKIVSIVVLSFSFIFLSFILIGADDSRISLVLDNQSKILAALRDSQDIVSAKDEQISILRWIGVTIVTSLTTVIAFLYKDLARSRRVIVEEVRGATEIKVRLVKALENLNCPYLKNRTEDSAP